jgi:hypothetical protein
MSTHHSRRMTRKDAEQLLGGAAGPGADPGQHLSRVLAAAAAPGHESELTGEAKAVAAFEVHHLVSATTPRRGQMINSPLAKLLTAKALAATLAVAVTGGVALAASTGILSGPKPALRPGAARSASDQPGASTSPSGAVRLGRERLCRSLAAAVAALPSAHVSANVGGRAGLEQALASPALSAVVTRSTYASLVTTVNGSSAVPDYCALLLGLPRLPQPDELSRVPASALAEILPNVPASALARILTSLPAATLAEILGELPTSTLAQVLTALPTAALSEVLTTLPATALDRALTTLPPVTLSHLLTTLPGTGLGQVLTTLPAPTLSQVLTALPATVLGRVLTALPAATLSRVLAALPATTASRLLAELPASVLSPVLRELPASVLGHLPSSLLSRLPLG